MVFGLFLPVLATEDVPNAVPTPASATYDGDATGTRTPAGSQTRAQGVALRNP